MLTKLPLAEAADFFSGDFADFLAGLALVVVAFFALAAVLRVVFAMISSPLGLCKNVSCWELKSLSTDVTYILPKGGISISVSGYAEEI